MVTVNLAVTTADDYQSLPWVTKVVKYLDTQSNRVDNNIKKDKNKKSNTHRTYSIQIRVSHYTGRKYC